MESGRQILHHATPAPSSTVRSVEVGQRAAHDAGRVDGARAFQDPGGQAGLDLLQAAHGAVMEADDGRLFEHVEVG
jgi:hypothetical protein